MSIDTDKQVTVTYGGVTLDDCPLVTNMVREYKRKGNGQIFGSVINITLNGLILEKEGGLDKLLTKKQILSETFSCDGQDLVITCGGTTVFTGCVKVMSLTFSGSQNNWVTTIPYVLQLQSYTVSTIASCEQSSLTNIDESWSIELAPECYYYEVTGTRPPNRYSISHSLSASAEDYCTGNGLITGSGFETAKQWVTDHLGFDENLFYSGDLGVTCLTGLQFYDHNITNTMNPCDGSYSAVESWIVVEDIGSGIFQDAVEDFTIDVSKNRQSRIKNVSMQGTIKGYEKVDIGTCRTVTQSKLQSAQNYWNEISGQLLARAEVCSDLSLNPIPVQCSYACSPKTGLLTYNVQYDTCMPCLPTEISGCQILSESITHQNTHPNDVYASIQILGRPCPILQCLGIKTKGTKTIAVSLVADCGDVCYTDPSFYEAPFKGAIQDVFDNCYEYLTGQYGQVFSDSESESWDPKTGAYNRQIQYSYSTCCTGTEL